MIKREVLKHVEFGSTNMYEIVIDTKRAFDRIENSTTESLDMITGVINAISISDFGHTEKGAEIISQLWKAESKIIDADSRAAVMGRDYDRIIKRL